MSTQTCQCAVLKGRVESLTSANTTYRMKIRKLLIENGTLRLLIEQLTFRGGSDAAQEENKGMVSAEDNGNPTFESYYNQTTDQRAVGVLNATEYEEDVYDDSIQFDDETEDADICHYEEDKEEDPPWESEPSGSSTTNCVDEEDRGVISSDSPEDEDGIELKMVNGVFHMADDVSPASQAYNNSSLSDSNDAPDNSLWSLDCSWKCALCNKNIRGHRRHRLKHIVTHKKFKFSCPFDGCAALLNFWSFKDSHVSRRHHVEYENLSVTMKQHVEDERAKLVAKAQEFEREVFPEKNLCDADRFKNDKCKVCSAKVLTHYGQTFHIAAHLNLQLSCPVDGCNNRYELTKIYQHLRFSHPPMSQAIKKKLKEARSVCHCAAAEARELFF